MKVYLFWKSKLISNFDYKDRIELFKLGRDLIDDALRRGHPLKYQKAIYHSLLDNIAYRKINKKPIWNSDHQGGLGCMMALIVLKDIEEIDDPTCGLFYPPE